MAPRRRRLRLLLVILALLSGIFMIRSLWRRDTIAWQSVSTHEGSVILTSYGVETRQLGIVRGPRGEAPAGSR